MGKEDNKYNKFNVHLFYYEIIFKISIMFLIGQSQRQEDEVALF